MELLEVLRTTGAVRAFTTERVGDDALYRVLEVARFAPSGGNRQGWRVVVVQDPARRQALRDLYLPGWYDYLAQRAAGLVPWAPVTDDNAERAAVLNAPAMAAAASPDGFAEQLHRVPVLLAILADLRALAAVDKDAERYSFAGGASVYPFVWSVLLAARAEGLAGVITTMAVRRESEVCALLEVPEEFALAAVVALGHPVQQPRRLTRSRVEDFTTIDSFGGQPFVAEGRESAAARPDRTG